MPTFLEFAECTGNVNKLSLNVKEIHLEMIDQNSYFKVSRHIYLHVLGLLSFTVTSQAIQGEIIFYYGYR